MEFSGKCYRISNSKHAEDLSGEGAYLFGGRWNSIGVRMLYSSESSSLSILEVLAYVTNTTFATKSIITLEIPKDSVREIPLEVLKPGWDIVPASDYTKKIGDDWIKSMESLALIVPSVVNKHERNILINPLHTDFRKIKIISNDEFGFDRRLLAKV